MEHKEKELKYKIVTHPEENKDHLKNLGVSTAFFLDFVRPRKDGSFTVRIRIIFDRTPKYYTTKINLTGKDYKKITEGSPRGELGDKRKRIFEKLREVNKVIEGMNEFSFDKFDQLYTKKGKNYSDVFKTFITHTEELKASKEYNTASTYDIALKSFLKYYFGKKRKTKYEIPALIKKYFEYNTNASLKFKDIDNAWLMGYDKWMRDNNKSSTTISINTRCLRKLFNEAIDEKAVDKRYYPFGNKQRKKYAPPKHRNNKRPLSLNQIEAIYNYQSKDYNREYYRDIFIFSYISYGLNITDICRLQKKDIDNKYIEIIRQKTKDKDETFKIRILLSDDHKRIIDKYSNGGKYVFSIIDGLKDEKAYKRIKQFTHNLNDNMKAIASELKFDNDTCKKISSYYARHSFASIARDAQIPVSTISQCMGHSTGFGITGNYLGAPPDEMLQKIHEVLLPFKFNKFEGIEALIYEKLNEMEQSKFILLSKTERENYIKELILNKI